MKGVEMIRAMKMLLLRPSGPRARIPWPNGSFLQAELERVPSSSDKLRVRVGQHELLARNNTATVNGKALIGKQLIQVRLVNGTLELRPVPVQQLIEYAAKIFQLAGHSADEYQGIHKRLTHAFQLQDSPVEVRMERGGELLLPYAVLVEPHADRDFGYIRLGRHHGQLALRFRLKFHVIEHLFVELTGRKDNWKITVYEPSGKYIPMLNEALQAGHSCRTLVIKEEYPQWARLDQRQT